MILVVGCGFLGSYLVRHITSLTDEPVIATVRDMKNIPSVRGAEYVKCSVENEAEIAALAEKTRGNRLTVFYFAASHNVDFVFEHPEEAGKVNIKALENFLGYFDNIDKLFFASTDCVYGENSDSCPAFSEDAQAVPINRYGEQKKQAEDIVLSKGFNVLRFPFMIGASLSEKKHFYDNICQRLDNGEETEMIDGMIRSVISYENAAKLMWMLACSGEALPEIINVCGDEALSKYETGCLIAQKKGLSQSLIKKISEEEGSKFFKDRRARSAVMDNSLLKRITGLKKIPWEGDLC